MLLLDIFSNFFRNYFHTNMYRFAKIICNSFDLFLIRDLKSFPSFGQTIDIFKCLFSRCTDKNRIFWMDATHAWFLSFPRVFFNPSGRIKNVRKDIIINILYFYYYYVSVVCAERRQ